MSCGRLFRVCVTKLGVICFFVWETFGCRKHCRRSLTSDRLSANPYRFRYFVASSPFAHCLKNKAL